MFFLPKQIKVSRTQSFRNKIFIDPEKITAITNLSAPTTVQKVCRIPGRTSWCRKFLPLFSQITAPVKKLLKKKKYKRKQEKAFGEFKKRLIEAPVLACPNF